MIFFTLAFILLLITIIVYIIIHRICILLPLSAALFLMMGISSSSHKENKGGILKTKDNTKGDNKISTIKLRNKHKVKRVDGKIKPKARYVVLRVDADAKDRDIAIKAAKVYMNGITDSIAKQRIKAILDGEISNQEEIE